MQALERDLCARLNTLAAVLLGHAQPGAKPATPPAKGKGKGKARQKAAEADGVSACLACFSGGSLCVVKDHTTLCLVCRPTDLASVFVVAVHC